MTWALLVLLAGGAAAVEIGSPGMPSTPVDAAGRLVEDWGTLGVKLSGAPIVAATPTIAAIKLDGAAPAVRATSDCGAVRLTTTAYRAPIHPLGVDVLEVRIEAKDKPAAATLALDLPAAAKASLRTVRLGNRPIVTLPAELIAPLAGRDWGSMDESVAMPGWAKPATKCDKAFANIRAGMGGVPIRYRFAVKPGQSLGVVLGFCESHWSAAGYRVMTCRVDGAGAENVDPVARFGRHKPGIVAFAGRDENRDGLLELSVRGAAGSRDGNPILNAIWLFAGTAPADAEVVAGRVNDKALRYVDVGGAHDQSLYPPPTLAWPVALAAGEAKEFVFFAACHGQPAPIGGQTAWTAAALRRSAIEVWRDWR